MTDATADWARRPGLHWVVDPDDPLQPTVGRWDARRRCWWLIGAEVPYPGDLEPLGTLIPPPHVLPTRAIADVLADAEAAGDATMRWPAIGYGYRDRDTGARYVVADVAPVGGVLTSGHRPGGRLFGVPSGWVARVRYAD
ncbi:hypothetical protein [Roseomonas genomospecies 6]|uniref:Uncharacterized protein n=1 Tax=Roseomonas genomospecies 6 TaxID=214106 RepID=A0A9W7TYU5_9PROT|nr:hypothetical protein [Roseomonas genomospecies 6]KAA0680346.1 hypothetical protein DS843_13615 [Roseomonas genomospecies 6]